MILLDEFINILSTGVLSNTAFSGTDGILKESHYSKISNATNMGIIELYKRFKFMQNELVLHVTPETTNYYLRANRVTSIANISAVEYIEEAPDVDGFLNIIKVLAAFDSSGVEIRINHPRVYQPLDTSIPTIIELGKDVLQITNVIAPQTISIVYQSYPTKLTTENFYYPELKELSIPDTIIDPLVSYVASKVFKPMGANDSTASADKSATYEQAYELACQKLEMYGLDVQDTTERDTFVSNGWV